MTITPPAQLLADNAHRPYPMSTQRWAMAQTWRDLLFAHWAVPAEMIHPLIPSELTLDIWDGKAWVGVVPFHMTHIRPHGLPPSIMSHFIELNVRTYVTYEGRPGVWFFSLDATHRLAVEGARNFFHLPYFMAQMSVKKGNDQTINYGSIRRDKRSGAGVFFGAYRPTSPIFMSTPGSLEAWLTERYCLYAQMGKSDLFRAEIHHAQWRLQEAELEQETNTVAKAHGIALEGAPLTLHYVEQIDVLAWYVNRLK